MLKLPIDLVIKNNFNLNFSEEQEKSYLIAQGDSLFIDQLWQICGHLFVENENNSIKLPQIVLIEAKKSESKNKYIKKVLEDGFAYNGIHFIRFGKSASQGKDGITMFIDESLYEPLFQRSQLDIQVDQCVISKYESQRNLILSTSTLINTGIPYIVVVDEYKKIIPNQKIKYVKEVPRDITDKKSGKPKTINVRIVEEGIRDVSISPFDGCGCHDANLGQLWSAILGLDYNAVGFQVRLPFLKGYSVEIPFKEYFKSMGVTQIKDVFGKIHNVQDIDAIWNVSMWKGYGIFKGKYGTEGWKEYISVLNKYQYKIGITKYSHHIKNLNLKTRFNFQYLQCLNIWNPKYMQWFDEPVEGKDNFDVLDENNWGSMLKLASYTTGLYENIIKGNKGYTLKFMGILDSELDHVINTYVQATLINNDMFKDPEIKRYVARKLKRQIEQARIGKIYADGFYHT
jgi:hypothetical protein